EGVEIHFVQSQIRYCLEVPFRFGISPRSQQGPPAVEQSARPALFSDRDVQLPDGFFISARLEQGGSILSGGKRRGVVRLGGGPERELGRPGAVVRERPDRKQRSQDNAGDQDRFFRDEFG